MGLSEVDEDAIRGVDRHQEPSAYLKQLKGVFDQIGKLGGVGVFVERDGIRELMWEGL